MLLQELAQLNVARLTVEERWTLMRSAEKASEYVVIRRDAINSPKDARGVGVCAVAGAGKRGLSGNFAEYPESGTLLRADVFGDD